MDLFSFPLVASASGSNSLSNRPSKLRSACNRCHSQKLKCTRNERDASCQRCSRLKTACYFGPRASQNLIKSLKRTTENVPADSATPLPASEYEQIPIVPSSSVAGNMTEDDWVLSSNMKKPTTDEHAICFPVYDNHTSIDPWTPPRNVWERQESSEPGFNFTILGGPMTNSSSNLSWSEPTYTASTYQDSSRLGNREITPISMVRKLANLTVSLSELADQLPSVSKSSTSSAGVANKCRNGHSPKRSTMLIFDDFFRLTKDFTALVESTCEAEESGVTDTPSLIQRESDPTLLLDPDFPHVNQSTNISSDVASIFSPFDEATVLSMASCHCHLINIYTSIFEMMQACITQPLVTRIGEDWAVILPRLQVGDYVTSPPVRVDFSTPMSSKKKTAIYMLMITTLSSQLWEQLARAMRMVHSRVSQGSLSDFVWNDATRKNECLIATIMATKSMVNDFSVVVE